MPIKTESSPTFQVLSCTFEVPTLPGAPRVIDPKRARSSLSVTADGKRVGCYIFALKKGKRLMPWYVGKATKGFAQEVFNGGNCHKYDEALGLAGTGKPVLLLIAAPQKKGAINLKAIDKLETMLVEECGGQNPDIRNQRKSVINPWCRELGAG